MPPADAVTLTRILHPCVLVTHGERRALFDPCFGTFTRRRITAGFMGIGLPEPGVQPEALEGLTLIALTHGHEDHFDVEGMARLPSRSSLIVVPGPVLARRVRRLGFHDVAIPGPGKRDRLSRDGPASQPGDPRPSRGARATRRARTLPLMSPARFHYPRRP